MAKKSWLPSRRTREGFRMLPLVVSREVEIEGTIGSIRLNGNLQFIGVLLSVGIWNEFRLLSE